MEFHEKLQILRKSRGLTQEELAEILCVSRAAVSKWESGRGYPSIDSLKDIAACFSVTIDELLSGDKLVFIAEKENKANLRHLCGRLLGVVDLLSVLLMILPLYPKTVDGYVYCVNLWMYTETAVYNRWVYWILFLSLTATGIWILVLTQRKGEHRKNVPHRFSLAVGMITVFYLVLAREAYAAAISILLLVVKALLMYWSLKSGD